MDKRHLTDDEIQDYLDNRSPELVDRVEKHVASCRPCESMLHNYANIYSGLSDDIGFELPADFANNVIKANNSIEHESFLNRFGNQILMSIVLAVAAASLIMLSDISLFSGFISKTGALLETSLVRIFADSSASASGMIGLILQGMFAVLAVWILDRLVFYAKKKPSTLMI